MVLVIVLFGSWVHFDVNILQTVPGVCRITFLKVLDVRRPSRHFLFLPLSVKETNDSTPHPRDLSLVQYDDILLRMAAVVKTVGNVDRIFFTKTQQSPQSDELQIIERLH